MRWQGGRRSRNVEHRRGIGVAAGGGVGILVLILALLFGIDPGAVIETGGDPDAGTQLIRKPLRDNAEKKDKA